MAESRNLRVKDLGASATRDHDELVVNDGRSLNPDFELNRATGLGLSIVRTLVTTELDGTIAMRAGEPEDFTAVGLGDHPRGTGTVIDLTVPV